MKSFHLTTDLTLRMALTIAGLCASTTLAGAATTLTFTPATLSFPVTITGNTSAAQTTTVKNTGATTATISSIAIAGVDSTDFAISTKTCTTSLLSGATCTVSVVFKPVEAGIRQSSLTFTDNATGSPQTVALSGTAESATQGISFFPTSISFPATTVGVTSGSLSTTVTNYGSASVTFTGVHLQGTNAGDFAITSNGCTTVTQGNTCGVSVNFTPTAAGVRQATIQFTDSLTGSPQVVPLVGTAQTATLTVSVTPTSASFGTVNVGTTTNSTYFAVYNSGTSAVTYTSATLTGTNAADFAITNQTNCVNAGILTVGGTCYVYVTFTPSATGVRTATLNITDNATGSPQTATLYGVGQTATDTISFSKGTLDLGVEPLTVASGQTYVAVQNTGTTPVTFTSVVIGGTDPTEFAITSNGCSGTLNPLSTCYEYVNFTPAAAGQRTATLSFTDSATGSPQVVNLAGTGEAQTENLAFNYLDYGFGQIVLGATSNSYYEAVNNAGDVPVTFSSIALAGTNAADFTITSQGCPISPSTLGVGQTCYVYVTFSPSAAGVRSASLQFTDTGSGSPQSIGLGGLGLAQAQTLSFSVPSLVYPGSAVGTSTGSQVVTVTNTGDQPVTFTSVALTGAGASSFVISSQGCTTVQPASACNVYVYSDPAATGVLSASLSFTDSATGSPQAIPLTADGEPSSPALNPSVTDVNFSYGVVGVTSAATTITMTNPSGSAVTIAFSEVGPNAADFVVTSNTCTGSLGAGGNCSLKVAFDAGALGSRAAALRFTVASVAQDVLVAGVGSSASQLLTLQSTVDFGSTTVTVTSPQHAVSIQNTGAVPVNITSYAVAGADPGDFSVASNTCGAILAPDVICDVNLVFTPTAGGERTATLQVTDSATGSPQSVGLSGVGQTDSVSLTLPASAVDLGSTVTGSPVTVNIPVVNSGTAAVTITKAAISGTNATDFAVTYNPCTSMNAFTTCNIQVTFNPTAAGVRTATFSLTDNATGSPQSVTLVGVGQTSIAALAVAPALAFPAVALGGYNTQYLGLQNTGTVVVGVTGVTIAGANAADFTVYNSCQSIAAGSSCSLYLAFVPAAAGLRVATLTITDNATGSPQKVALTGVGQALNASLSIPQDLSFPAVTVGSYLAESFPIYNIGNTTILFTSVVVTGTNAADFQLLSSCPQMNPGAGCTIYVVFVPAAPGTLVATLQFTDSATGSPQSVTLTGIGQGKTASASMTPSALTFSNQTVGTQSGAQNVFVSNSGTLAVTVSKVVIGGTDPRDFQIIYNSCAGATLNPGSNQYCYAQVVFTPTATGTRTATITATDTGTGGTQSATLTGTGQ